MSVNKIDLEWTTDDKVCNGFYYALMQGRNKGIEAVCVVVTTICGKTGAHCYVGENENGHFGGPQIRKMSDEFLMWARLPDPINK